MMRHEQASESRNSSEENFVQASNGELSFSIIYICLRVGMYVYTEQHFSLD